MEASSRGQIEPAASGHVPALYAIWDEMPAPGECVVRVTGEADLAARASFVEALESARARLPETVTVDLGDCRLIDSVLMKELVSAAEAARERSVKFYVLCPHGPLRKLLELSGVGRRLELLPRA